MAAAKLARKFAKVGKGEIRSSPMGGTASSSLLNLDKRLHCSYFFPLCVWRKKNTVDVPLTLGKCGREWTEMKVDHNKRFISPTKTIITQ